MAMKNRTLVNGRGPVTRHEVRSAFLAVLALWMLGGCATSHPRGEATSGFGLHSRSSSFRSTVPIPMEMAGAAGGFPEKTTDPFQEAQEASGLDEEARHLAGGALYPEQARQLLLRLTKTRVTG